MVFWWTGRGYLSLLSLIGVYGGFGALVTFAFGNTAFERQPWLWGIGAFLAAAVNWVLGCRLNRKPLTFPLDKLRARLFYRPRNRFLSFPMESASVAMALLGCFLLVRGLLPTI